MDYISGFCYKTYIHRYLLGIGRKNVTKNQGTCCWWGLLQFFGLSGNHETMSVLTKFSLLIQLKFYILLATGCPTERFCRFQRKRKERCCGEFSS
uniref:Uncharacterized protein n=1 Tax=Oryza nivara TaxID=4536 RepID=A0A0E0HCP9_ORYNI